MDLDRDGFISEAEFLFFMGHCEPSDVSVDGDPEYEGAIAPAADA